MAAPLWSWRSKRSSGADGGSPKSRQAAKSTACDFLTNVCSAIIPSNDSNSLKKRVLWRIRLRRENTTASTALWVIFGRRSLWFLKTSAKRSGGAAHRAEGRSKSCFRRLNQWRSAKLASSDRLHGDCGRSRRQALTPHRGSVTSSGFSLILRSSIRARFEVFLIGPLAQVCFLGL